MENQVVLYDALLREGAQTEGIHLSLQDKLMLTEALDSLGIQYIEGGWPGSNPTDIAFFREAKRLHLRSARLAAFGMTRRARFKAGNDPLLRDLLRAGTPTVTLFGKSWDFHVKNTLRISCSENLDLISETVFFLKKRTEEVFYDAEHFFDGFRSNPDYALETLAAALTSGADAIVLCDTNGGSVPDEIKDVTARVRRCFPEATLGIHCHNDGDLAVANTLAAVAQGATQVQGCLNGLGERCGNANLSALIPTLALKWKVRFGKPLKLERLTSVSRLADEICNVHPRDNAPYVGKSAFAHKAGVHIAAVKKAPAAYEHIHPEEVGNRRKMLLSDQAGLSVIIHKAGDRKIRLRKNTPEARQIIKTMKTLESEGYQFEGAEASFDILVKKALGRHRKFFDLVGFRVIDENRGEGKLLSEATIQVKVNGVLEITTGKGDGPVNALDCALRKALTKFYPSLKELHLTDFKVRVLNAKEGTAARVRVLIESSDLKDSWGTVGVSTNIIEASWEAIVDSIDYKLMKDDVRSHRPKRSRV